MNTNGDDHVFNLIKNSKVIKILLLILIVVSIIANGVQGYFLLKQAKSYRNLEAIINSKSNCDKCPAQVETTPESTPAPTGSSSSGSSAGTSEEDTVAPLEDVIPPPPPPAD